MKKIYFTVFFATLLAVSVQGQGIKPDTTRSNGSEPDTTSQTDNVNDGGDGSGAISDLISLNVRVPPSPTASSLAKFIDVPVSHFSGIAQVAIPLFSIQERELQVNVSLNYHGSGVKVDERAGWAGTNWALEYGGSVTRVMRGLPDESTDGFISNYSRVQSIASTSGSVNLNDSQNLDALQKGLTDQFDSEPDIFMFSFANYSGKLYITPTSVVLVPYQKLAVSASYSTTGINSFTFVTPQGISYNFSISEKNETIIPNGGSPIAYNSSWFLSSIQSPNGYSISFEYYLHSVAYDQNSFTAHDLTSNPGSNPPCAASSSSVGYMAVQINNARKIKKITFSNGYLEFFGSAGREDTGSGFTDWKLDRIDLKNTTGGLIKRYDLTYGYLTASGGGKRLKLASVKEVGSNLVALPGYIFAYEEQNVPPMGSLSQDQWGYFNGKANSVLYPAMTTSYPTNPTLAGADRSTDIQYLKGGTLKSITYPTGGSTSFEYEAHVGTIDGTQQYVGGLRILKIIHNDPVAVKSFRKTYQYDLSQTVLTYRPRFDYQQTIKQQNGTVPGDLTNCLYIVRTGSNQSGLGSAEHIVYKHVTELNADNTANGKTEYFFTYVSNNGTNNFPFPPPTDFSWLSGLLLEKKVSNSSGAVISRVVNEYNNAQGNTSNAASFMGYKVGRKIFYGSGQLQGTDQNVNYDGVFAIEPFYVYSRWQFLTKTTNYLYDPSAQAKVVTKTDEFFYENASHAQMTRHKTTDSRQNIVETTYKYPHDFSSTVPYTEMISNYIISPVIEQQEKVATVNSHYKKTDFEKFGTKFLPKRVKTKLAAGAEYEEVVIDTYDTRGNVTKYTERSGISTRMLWYTTAGKADLLNTRTVSDVAGYSQTTTYDYNPLIGIKSVADPNGKVIAYEYDAYSRLTTLRNNSVTGPVRSSYCYNYAGQVVTCPSIATTGKVTPPTLVLLCDECAALPVTLVSFSAVREGRSAFLNWKTTSETQSERFDVERSSEGKKWVKIGSVNAAGESQDIQYYSFRDTNPLRGENLYRLKMVDADASFAYSRVESLKFESADYVYPNPISSGQKLHLEVKDADKIQNVIIYDALGRVAYSIDNPEQEIDINTLKSGAYLIQITASNGSVTTYQIVKH